MSNKRYTATNFLVDLLLTMITGGLWLLWIIFRYLRSN